MSRKALVTVGVIAVLAVIPTVALPSGSGNAYGAVNGDGTCECLALTGIPGSCFIAG